MKRTTWAGILAAAAIAAVPLGTRGEPAADKADPWVQAERSFKEYLAPILEAARNRHGDPTIQDAEYRSELLRKHLPEYRIRVKTGPYDGTSKLFLLTREGKILDLGETLWRGDASGLRVREISDFLKTRKLPVRSAAEAIEAARLTEELQGAPGYVGFLQLNTNGFRVFDSHFISRFYGPPTDWKYTAEPHAKGWTVKREYVGPPAMVPLPPVYEISVDDEKHFADLRNVASIRVQ